VDSPPPTNAERRAYARIRAWTDEDIVQVARNAGLDEDVVRAAHQHMIVDKHTLTIDGTQYEGWFSPTYSDMWEAVHRNPLLDPQISEFRNLIAHEWIEDQMEAMWRMNGIGEDYYRPFIPDTKYGGYMDTPLTPQNFAPHDIAPHSSQLDFVHEMVKSEAE